MAFDWNGYLSLAKELQTETDGQITSTEIEAKQRSGVSRAYYSVYHLAEDYAITHFGYTPTKKGGGNQFHADLREEYRKRFGNVDHQEIRQILFRLHKARKDCDYERDVNNLPSLLQSTIIDADKIVAVLAN